MIQNMLIMYVCVPVCVCMCVKPVQSTKADSR